MATLGIAALVIVIAVSWVFFGFNAATGVAQILGLATVVTALVTWAKASHADRAATGQLRDTSDEQPSSPPRIAFRRQAPTNRPNRTFGISAIALSVVFILLVTLIRAIMVAGGSQQNPPDTGCAVKPGSPVVLVTSRRANSPAPGSLERLTNILTRSAENAEPEFVTVKVDGEPAVVNRTSMSAQNRVVQERAVHSFLDQALRTKANAPEVDVLTALETGARAAHSAGSHGTVVLLDSALSTAGPIDFRVPGALDAPPDEIVNHLQKTGYLPDFRNLGVVLLGVGEVAAPQKRLSPRQRNNLTEIWSSIARAGGAGCVTTAAIGGSTPPENVPSVSLVDLPDPARFDPNVGAPASAPVVIPDVDDVGFAADSAELDEAARTVLEPLATWLHADLSRKVTLTGTTADLGSKEQQLALSTQRARSMADALIALGVRPEQIAVIGVGSDFPGYIRDQDEEGHVLPGPAQANRSVRITVGNS